jgi:uncharacterized coiled-coil protein SlyX
MSVLDLVGDLAGDTAPKLPPKAREHAAAVLDAGLEKMIEASHRVAVSNAGDARLVIRLLGAALLVLAFVLVGFVLWSLGSRIEKVEVANASRETQIENVMNLLTTQQSEAAAHRARLDANVKTLAAHAVALTRTVNTNAKANYELLDVIVEKLDARKHVPKLHEPPASIEAPVTLKWIAGER